MSQKNKTTYKCSDCGCDCSINKQNLNALKKEKVKLQCKKCRAPVLKMSGKEVDAEVDRLADNFSEPISIIETDNKSVAEPNKSGTASSRKAGVSFHEESSDDEHTNRHASRTVVTPDKSAKQRSGVKSTPSPASATAIPRVKTPKEIESADRKKGVKLSVTPHRRKNPMNIYCNGGTRCGYKIEYELSDDFALSGEGMPKKCCDPGSSARHRHEFLDPNKPKKCTNCKKDPISVADRPGFCVRGSHDCGWDYMLCTVNGCILNDDYHDLSPEQVEYLFYHYACPICDYGLHGGVSSTYGIIFH